MATVKMLLISIVLLSLLSFSFPLPCNSISRAIEILKNSSFVTMAAILQFGNQTLINQSSTLTIFSPTDSAFASSGQPSLLSLQLHFSPLYFSSDTLKSLPSNSKIPSLYPNHYLVINSDGPISLNGVKIQEPAIFNDGSLIIFGVDSFFKPSFKSSYEPNATKIICTAWLTNRTMNFDKANEVLIYAGYSVMASFLGLQLLGIRRPTLLTVFAPADEAMLGKFGNFSEYPSIFLRHVVPCRVLWDDLAGLEVGTSLPTFLEGFKINITKPDWIITRVNGVRVVSPNLYYNDWLVVHGVTDILPSSQIRSTTTMETKTLVAFYSLFLCIYLLLL